MSYLGSSATTQAFTPAIDSFSGNGSTTVFTLSRPVASVAQIQVTVGSTPQNPNTAFTVNGNTLTFTSAPASGTNNIYVYYTSPITQVIAPSAGTVQTSSMATGAVTQSILASGVGATGPAFSAYMASGQNITTGTATKVVLNAEEFDTNNNFDSTTNYRFTPTVAGYYAVTAHSFWNLGVTSIVCTCLIYKNGSAFKNGFGGGSNTSGYFTVEVNALIYMNGSTDYLEVYVQQYSGSTQSLGNGGGTSNVWFSGSLVRAA